MGSTIVVLATGAASSGLWAIFGALSWSYGLRPLYQWHTQRRPLRRVLNIPKGRTPVIVHSAVPNPDETEFFAYLVTPDCLFGHHQIQTKLAALGNISEDTLYRFPKTLSTSDMKCDLILIGGYENNAISENLTSESSQVFMKENKIHIRGNEAPFDVELDASGDKIVKDYCIISRRSNPYCREESYDRTVISFEGIRHYGTEAGIKFLSNKNLKRRIFKGVEKAKELYIVVSCGVFHLDKGNYFLRDLNLEYLWFDGKSVDVSDWSA